MISDSYKNIARDYDKMKTTNPHRVKFLKTICDEFDNPRILDCSCGTGSDAQTLHNLGYDVTCSDYSDSMLELCRERFKSTKSVRVLKVDFHKLEEVFTQEFDVILCLSNSINEEDNDPHKALNSMKRVLNQQGVIIIDQGQTDLSMSNPPSHHAIVNVRDFSRLLTMTYTESTMTVNVFDFIHSQVTNGFTHSTIHITIRLLDQWKNILKKVNLECEYYGGWEHNQYDKDTSMRLIIKARKGD